MRRRRFSRKSFKPKRKSFRRTAFRSRRIMKSYSRPDGISPLKFTVTQDVTYAAASTIFYIGWHSNITVAGTLQCNDAPEFALTANLYELQKTKGLKIHWEPVGNDNLPANRYVKTIHIGSFPNESVSDIAASVPTIARLSQRLDYKTYNGSRSVKRYYKVSKALRNSFQ